MVSQLEGAGSWSFAGASKKSPTSVLCAVLNQERLVELRIIC